MTWRFRFWNRLWDFPLPSWLPAPIILGYYRWTLGHADRAER